MTKKQRTERMAQVASFIMVATENVSEEAYMAYCTGKYGTLAKTIRKDLSGENNWTKVMDRLYKVIGTAIGKNDEECLRLVAFRLGVKALADKEFIDELNFRRYMNS